ncbi:MAG: phosphoglycerate dehydrogenase [Planctomycetes bacterium]|nr:phosphoglycerate dehydrogenase [Planctomycetota bacterium]
MKALLYDYHVVKRRDLLRSHLTTDWRLASLPDVGDRDRVRGEIADADAFVGNVFSADLRDAADNLKLIHCIGAGVDGIPPDNVPPGCVVCNVHEHEIPISEYIMLAILLSVTRLPEAQARFRQGEWHGSGRAEGEFHGEAAGKTLGLIGYGHIGWAVAARARAFGMNVIAVTRRPRDEPTLDWCGPIDDLDRLLATSDFVAVVCPLTDRTRGLLGEAQLRRLKPTAFLINVARAEIIDEEPLYRALRERWFAGAALDVWYQYPPKPGVLLHGSRLPFHELENVITTPHFAAWTESLIERRYRRIAENLDRLACGVTLERVVYQAPVGAVHAADARG